MRRWCWGRRPHWRCRFPILNSSAKQRANMHTLADDWGRRPGLGEEHVLRSRQTLGRSHRHPPHCCTCSSSFPKTPRDANSIPAVRHQHAHVCPLDLLRVHLWGQYLCGELEASEDGSAVAWVWMFVCDEQEGGGLGEPGTWLCALNGEGRCWWWNCIWAGPWFGASWPGLQSGCRPSRHARFTSCAA